MVQWFRLDWRVAVSLETWVLFPQVAETLCSRLVILRGTEPFG